MCFFSQQIVFGQSIFKNTEFTFGYGIQEQDRRLFEFPWQDDIIAKEDSKFDHQYDLILSERILNKNLFMISSGLGYSLFQSKFSRPFNQNYFTSLGTYEGRTIEKYSIHSLKFVNNFYLNFKLKNKNIIYFGAPIALNFAFNKSITGTVGNWNENKWIFELYNFEIYSSVGLKIDRFTINASYRMYNLQKIDPVIFNFILFRPSNQTPGFLTKKNETINWNKILLNVGYQF